MFLVSLLFVSISLLLVSIDPYSLFKFKIFYYSCLFTFYRTNLHELNTDLSNTKYLTVLLEYLDLFASYEIAT